MFFFLGLISEFFVIIKDVEEVIVILEGFLIFLCDFLRVFSWVVVFILRGFFCF